MEFDSIKEKEKLLSKIQKNNKDANLKLIEKAYDFAQEMHLGQNRLSGEPFFSHPVAVANLLTEYNLDDASIITGLLHDVIEDTDASYEDVAKKFSAEIADLVLGVTKISNMELKSEKINQLENYRRLIVAMTKDIRVLIVKLCDRLHNLRTMEHVKKEEKRHKKARETLNIYAPLAGRIGMDHIKKQLEELAFEINYPEDAAYIKSNLESVKKESKQVIPKIISELTNLFKEYGMIVEVSGREKTPYSIWLKMNRKQVMFHEIYDIVAFRIVVENIEDCYKCLGIIHSKYKMIPGKFKDYISTPKDNGYQSLHTVIVGPESHRIEIQIRTEKMHMVAELGVAAHWQYKEVGSEEGIKHKKQFDWVRNLLEIVDSSKNPEEFAEQTKIAIFQDRVFCFSPKGDLVSLPAGATPIDFAYSIHSAIGNHCVGAKINGTIANIRTHLKNGDQVEIITSKSQNPSKEWERYVVTAKARAEIKKYVRSKKIHQLKNLGKGLIQKVYSDNDLLFNEKDLARCLPEFGLDDINDLYVLVGEGEYSQYTVFYNLYPDYSPAKKNKKDTGEFDNLNLKKKDKKTRSLALKGIIRDMPVSFAKCCHPIPGDKIIGIINTGSGVTVHRVECSVLEKYNDEPERWYDLSWDENLEAEKKFIARISVLVDRSPNALSEITSIFAKEKASIFDIKVTNRTEQYIDFMIDVEVGSIELLEKLMGDLNRNKLVHDVNRVD